MVAGLTLTDANPRAQSVYLKVLRLNPQTGPLCFQVLERHNLFGWKIWLLFKHYFHDDAEEFLKEAPKEHQKMLLWAEDHMRQYSNRATARYGGGFSLERDPRPY